MKLSPRLIRWFLVLALSAMAGGGGAGCKTNREPENESSIPWNTPKSWEHGIPGGMGGMLDRR